MRMRLWGEALGNRARATANNGNVPSITQVMPTIGGVPVEIARSFGYDGINRLTSVSDGTNSRTFGYLQTGNMWAASSGDAWRPAQGAPAAAAWFDAATNRVRNLVAQTEIDEQAGNLVRDGARNYVYDVENRLVEISETVGQATITRATYAYDGPGRRVKKTLYATTNGAAAPVSTTGFVCDATGRLVAEYGGTADGERTYLTADHPGSMRVVTASGGAVRVRYDYLPFGELVPATAASGGRNMVAGYGGTGTVSQLFTGKERDGETGLDYFGARYFSAAEGRWTSPDWSEDPEPVPYADFSDPQTLNLYTYTGNNPLSITDPDGHCPWCLGALIGGVGGAGAYYLTQRATSQPVTMRGVIASGVGGAVTGATLGLATAPAAIGGLFTSAAIETGIAVKAGAAVGAGIAGGIVTRGIESGGHRNKSLGTLKQLGTDAAVAVGGEIAGAILAPVVKSGTTAGRAVTVGEEKLARGAKDSPSLPERQLQLRRQQQVAGGAAGAGLDAAVRSSQVEAERRGEEARRSQRERR